MKKLSISRRWVNRGRSVSRHKLLKQDILISLDIRFDLLRVSAKVEEDVLNASTGEKLKRILDQGRIR